MTVGAGTVVAGRYWLERPLGPTSWLAWSRDAEMVVRVVPGAVPWQLARLERERVAMGATGRADLCVYDEVGELEGAAPARHPDEITLFAARPFVPGLTVRELFRMPVSVEVGVPLIVAVCHAASAAVRAGVGRLGLTPENIIVAEVGAPILVDMGIHRAPDEHLRIPGEPVVDFDARYVPPEGVRAGPMRAAVYLVGILLYEAFCGQPPFEGGSAADILARHVNEPPTSPMLMARRHDRICPPELEPVIMRALEKDPALRSSSLESLADAVSRRSTGG